MRARGRRQAKADTVNGWQRAAKTNDIFKDIFLFVAPNVNAIWMQFTVIICQCLSRLRYTTLIWSDSAQRLDI